MNELKDNFESASENKGKEETESGEIDVALGALAEVRACKNY